MNQKLKTAGHYYKMANRIRALGNKLEVEGWQEQRDAYEEYVAGLMRRNNGKAQASTDVVEGSF